MYKSRIKSWGLNKYMKANEKEVIAQFISAKGISGPNLQTLSYKGRPIRADLVRRYCKRTKVHSDIADSLPAKADQNMLVKRSRSMVEHDTDPDPNTAIESEEEIDDDDQATSQDDRDQVLLTPPSASTDRSPSQSSLELILTPSHSTSTDLSERAVWHVLQYLSWHFACDTSFRGTVSFQPARGWNAAPATGLAARNQLPAANAASFFEKLLFGLETLAQESPQSPTGWTLINEACAMASDVLTEQYRGFLKLLIMNFTDDRWSVLPALREHLLQYLASLSARIHGPHHFLTSVLQLLKSVSVLESTAEALMQAMIDIFEHKYPTIVEYEVCQMKRALADIYRRSLDFHNASRVSQKMLIETETLKGRYHADTRRAARRLADIHIDQGHYETAEKEYEDLLQRSQQVDEGTVFALHALQFIRNRHHQSYTNTRHCPWVQNDYEQHLRAGLEAMNLADQDEIDLKLRKFSHSLIFREKWLRTQQYSDRILARWAIDKNTG